MACERNDVCEVTQRPVIECFRRVLLEIEQNFMMVTLCVVVDLVHDVLPPLAVGIRLLSPGSLHHAYQLTAAGDNLITGL
jgi:hypothetical protein